MQKLALNKLKVWYTFVSLKLTLKYAKNCPKCRICSYCFIKKLKTNDNIRWEKIFNEWIKEWYWSRQLWLQKSKFILDVLNYIREKLDNNLIYQIDIVYENVEYIMIDWTWISKEELLLTFSYKSKKAMIINKTMYYRSWTKFRMTRKNSG